MQKKTKESLIFFRDWLITNILFILFLTTWVYFIYPDLWHYIEKIIDIGTTFEAISQYCPVENYTEYEEFLYNETIGLTNHCEDDLCKIWAIIAWLRPYNTTTGKNDINPNIKRIKNVNMSCKEIAYAFTILARLNGMESKLCFTEGHALTITEVDDKYIMIDPSLLIVESFEFKEYNIPRKYLVCPW